MKKILYSIITVLGIISASSCGDMLDVESSRMVIEPELNQKTDSVFYANGVLQAMQQLADQYYFQNEMRGDLVKTTDKANLNLKNLADFSAGAENKYDSVYLYYKVINNCNYYLQHRDTTLQTGAVNVTIGEFAGIATFRAWAYLQLGRQYGNVPYVVEPVTTIAQINANTVPTDYNQIFASQAEYLEKIKSKYTADQIDVPGYGYTDNTYYSLGDVNWSSSVSKWFNSREVFIPLNIVLGDLYLEMGKYADAARCYYDYLYHAANRTDADGRIDNTKVNVNSVPYVSQSGDKFTIYSVDRSALHPDGLEYPLDMNMNQTISVYSGSMDWYSSYSHNADFSDVISYIPMAVNYTKGKTTDIPAAFGYDYYATQRGSLKLNHKYDFDCPITDELQVVPSDSYLDQARNTEFYYFTERVTIAPFNWKVSSAKLGDLRAFILGYVEGGDESQYYVYKPAQANVILYRTSTVWLHLAEALNQMGYPDAAFAVLKNGLHQDLSTFRFFEKYEEDANGNPVLDEDGNPILSSESHNDDKYYITPETWDFLTTTMPFCSTENPVFKNGTIRSMVGIHSHGCGAVDDLYSTYSYKTVVENKIKEISDLYGLGLDPASYTKADYQNAVEDLLCDEYAMEFAFEGTRYSDLRRIALSKNRSGIYGGNFGSKWFAKKLAGNNPTKSLMDPNNWYLPFK